MLSCLAAQRTDQICSFFFFGMDMITCKLTYVNIEKKKKSRQGMVLVIQQEKQSPQFVKTYNLETRSVQETSDRVSLLLFSYSVCFLFFVCK